MTTPDDAARIEKIRQLNDSFRESGKGGRIMFTGALAQESDALRLLVFAKVASFTAFETGNDPYGEHDFGSFEMDGRKYGFKMDYFDLAEEAHSPDPTDPMRTVRILSIFFLEDY